MNISSHGIVLLIEMIVLAICLYIGVEFSPIYSFLVLLIIIIFFLIIYKISKYKEKKALKEYNRTHFSNFDMVTKNDQSEHTEESHK